MKGKLITLISILLQFYLIIATEIDNNDVATEIVNNDVSTEIDNNDFKIVNFNFNETASNVKNYEIVGLVKEMKIYRKAHIYHSTNYKKCLTQIKNEDDETDLSQIQLMDHEKCRKNNKYRVFYLVPVAIVKNGNGNKYNGLEIVTLIYDESKKKFRIYALRANLNSNSSKIGINYGKVKMVTSPNYVHGKYENYFWYLNGRKNEYIADQFSYMVDHDKYYSPIEDLQNYEHHYMNIYSLAYISILVTGTITLKKDNVKYQLCDSKTICHIYTYLKFSDDKTLNNKYQSLFYLAKANHIPYAKLDENGNITNYIDDIIEKD